MKLLRGGKRLRMPDAPNWQRQRGPLRKGGMKLVRLPLRAELGARHAWPTGKGTGTAQAGNRLRQGQEHGGGA